MGTDHLSHVPSFQTRSEIPIIPEKKKGEKKEHHVGYDHPCRLFIRREEHPFDHRPIDRA